MEARRKYLLFAAVVALLFLPMVQRWTHLLPDPPLHGKQALEPKPEWTWATWQSGEYQAHANWHYTQEAGFRNWMVRTNNQLYYSLYRTAKVGDVSIGREGYLFSREELGLFGTPFSDSTGSVGCLLDSLRWLQDRLQEDGRHFLMVVVPNKVWAYPDMAEGQAAASPRHDFVLKAAAERGIHTLDLTQWYGGLRQRTGHPPYTRGGMHWSVIGQAYAYDTILHTLARQTQLPFADLRMDTVSWSPIPLYQDNDLAQGMNLLHTPLQDSTPYPKISWQGSPSQRVLVAADSYYDHFYHNHSQDAFEQSAYWFYMDDYHDHVRGMTPDSLVNLPEVLDRHNVLVLLLSTNNMLRMPRKFVSRLSPWYASPAYRERRIAKFISSMRADPVWMKAQEAKALEWGMPLDSVLRKDAIYLMESRKP